MNSNQDKIVKVPSVPNITREADNSIFNSVGFYSNLQDSLEDQRQKLLSVYQRLQNNREQ
jgi:hypothetical protein